MVEVVVQIQASMTTKIVCAQKLLQGYLSQLDLLTHENEDLCVGHGPVSVGVKPENKAQAELCNTPFH